MKSQLGTRSLWSGFSVFVFFWMVVVQSSAAGEPAGNAMAGKVVSVDGKVLIRQDGGAVGSRALKPGDNVKEGDVINTASNGKVKLLLQDMTILDLSSSALFKVQKFEPKHGGDRNVDLAMAYGTVRASVSRPLTGGGKFQIKTRTATMGVRGTEFIVQTAIEESLSGLSGGGKSADAGSASGDSKKGDGKKGDDRKQASSTKITVVQGAVEVSTANTPKEKPKSGDDRKLASSKPSGPVMLTAGTQLTASTSAPVSKPVVLSKADLNEVTSSAKLTDNTFQKAVNLNLADNSGGSSGNGSSGGGSGASTGSGVDSSVGDATRSAISQAITSSAPAPTTQAAPNVPPPPPPFVRPPGGGGGFSTIHIVVR